MLNQSEPRAGGDVRFAAEDLHRVGSEEVKGRAVVQRRMIRVRVRVRVSEH